jgi:hypothetical protein
LKPGDKIICIDNNFKNFLKLNKEYTVLYNDPDSDFYYIIIKEIPHLFFKSSRFILKSELRKDKLKKLNNV